MSVPRLMHGVPPPQGHQGKRDLVYQPLTSMDRRAIDAIAPGRVTYPVGSPQKRFARELQSATKLTENQRRFLWRTAWSYRRQITDGEVIEHAGDVREWANERPAGTPAAASEPVPTRSFEPTPEDVASLSGLFDEVRG